MAGAVESSGVTSARQNPYHVPADTADLDHANKTTDSRTAVTSGPACSFCDFVLYGWNPVGECTQE
jgi:hypothetical protein